MPKSSGGAAEKGSWGCSSTSAYRPVVVERHRAVLGCENFRRTARSHWGLDLLPRASNVLHMLRDSSLPAIAMPVGLQCAMVIVAFTYMAPSAPENNAKPAKLICATQKPSLGVASPPLRPKQHFFFSSPAPSLLDCTSQPRFSSQSCLSESSTATRYVQRASLALHL